MDLCAFYADDAICVILTACTPYCTHKNLSILWALHCIQDIQSINSWIAWELNSWQRCCLQRKVHLFIDLTTLAPSPKYTSVLTQMTVYVHSRTPSLSGAVYTWSLHAFFFSDQISIWFVQMFPFTLSHINVSLQNGHKSILQFLRHMQI